MNFASTIGRSRLATRCCSPWAAREQRACGGGGPDRSGAVGEAISLSGVVTDDAQPNPPGTVSNRWVKFSGPGTVTFSNENAAATSATFSDTGTYVLSLHSTDGQVKVFDQVTVTW